MRVKKREICFACPKGVDSQTLQATGCKAKVNLSYADDGICTAGTWLSNGCRHLIGEAVLWDSRKEK